MVNNMNGNNFIANLINIIRNNSNPNVYINNLIRQNPQIRTLLNQQRQSGMTWEQFTMQLAKQNNIDINPVIQGLNNNGIKF